MKIINYTLLEYNILQYKIYCDLDNTLTDFNKAYTDLGYNIHVKGDYTPEFYKNLSRAGEKFWSLMPWIKDGKELWNFIKKYNPTILSAPTHDPTSKSGKIKWIKRELGSNIEYILEWDKYKYAKPNHILIDDSESKITPWKEHGGIGILHTSARDTIEQLLELKKE